MPNKTVLFSDVHLGAPLLDDDEQRQERLISFLEHAAGQQATIYIVGDLFEFWFEYKHAIPNHNFAILAALHKLAREGVSIHYLAGNHDLWIGDFLEKQVGVTVHKNATEFRSGELNVFVTHGDGTAASDSGYRFLKRIFTNPINIALYRLLHPDFGIPFARRMSQVSRDQGDHKDPMAAEYREYARGQMQKGYSAVIMGHTHKPAHELLDGGHFINLGDWISHFSYCEIIDGSIALKKWPEQTIYRQPAAPGGGE